MTGPSRCVLCSSASETMNHLLDDCYFASELWDRGEQRFRHGAQVKGNPSETIASWPPKVFKNAILNRLWELFPGFLVWEIWKECNGRIFDEKGRPPEKLWLNIEIHLRETLGLTLWTREDFKAGIQERLILNEWGVTTIPAYQGRNQAIPQASNSPDCWSPPGSGSIKLNFNGAAQGNPEPAGYGGVARDHKGHVMGVYWEIWARAPITLQNWKA